MACLITQSCSGCGACAKICPVGAINGSTREKHTINSLLCIECEACGRICPESAVADSYGYKIEKLRKSLWLRPVIDPENCLVCSKCAEICPAGALSMTPKTAVLSSAKDCVSCAWCIDNCQFGAIVMEVRNADN